MEISEKIKSAVNDIDYLLKTEAISLKLYRCNELPEKFPHGSVAWKSEDGTRAVAIYPNGVMGFSTVTAEAMCVVTEYSLDDYGCKNAIENYDMMYDCIIDHIKAVHEARQEAWSLSAVIVPKLHSEEDMN